METPTTIGKLFERIAAVSKTVGSLKADKTNKEHNYDYISADQILSVAGSAMAEAGLIIIPAVTAEALEQVSYVNNYGKEKSRFDATVEFDMLVGDVDGNNFTAHWIGRGSDYATPDKALYKAITSGHKYFEMKLFNVGIGNPDGEHEEPVEDAQPARKTAPTPIAPPQDEPQPSNGSGRPLPPAKLRQYILDKAGTTNISRTASDKQRGLLVSMLDTVCEGDTDKRHTITGYLTGLTSTKDLTGPMVVTLLDWLKPEKDSGGAYIPDKYAEQEARAVWTAALAQEGQSEIPFD